MTALIGDMQTVLETIVTSDETVSHSRSEALAAVRLLSDATASLLRQYGQAPDSALSVAVPYLTLCGVVIGGWLMAKSQAIASSKADEEPDFYRGKQQIARCYFSQVLPESRALAQIVTEGGASIADADAALL